MSEPRRIGEGISDELRATLAKVGDGKVRPTGPNGRMRYCTKCERESADCLRINPAWDVPLAHSWSSLGHVYWSDQCKPCLDFDKRRREAMRGETHNGDGSPKPALGMRPAKDWGHRGDR